MARMTARKTDRFGSAAVMARILSAENITVTIDDNADTAMMDVNNRRLILPNFDPELTTEAITDGLIIHEVGHAIFTPPSSPPPKDEQMLRGYIEIMKNAGLPYPKSVEACRRSIRGLGSFYQMLFGIFNVVEDSRIERMMGRKYAGANRFLGAMYREMATQPKIPQLKDLQKLLNPKYLETANLVDRINVAIKFPMVNFRMEQWERDLVKMVESTETFQDTIDATIEVAKHIKFPPFNYDPQTGDDAGQNIPKQWMNPEDFENIPEDAKDKAQTGEGEGEGDSNSSPKSDSDSDSKGSSGKSSKSDNSKSSKASKSKASKSDSADEDTDTDSGAGSEGEDEDTDSGAGSEGEDKDTDTDSGAGSEDSESDSTDGAESDNDSDDSDDDETGETQGNNEGDESGESDGDSDGDSNSEGDSTDSESGEVSEGSDSDNGNQTKQEGGKASGNIGVSNFDPNSPSVSSTMDRLARRAVKSSDGKTRRNRMYSLPKYDEKGKNGFDGFIYDYSEVLENAGVPSQVRSGSYYNYNAHCNYTGSAESRVSRINALARKMNTRFNRDKAAKVFANTQTARTGRLDMVKLSMYQTQDDVFIRSQIEKSGKNHGVMILIDWSGSMSNVASAVIFQAAVYAKFCSLAGIPYDIYLFTDGNERYFNSGVSAPIPSGPLDSATGSLNNKVYTLNPSTRLVNLYSSRMSVREFSQMTKYLMNQNSNFWQGSKYGAMGGTPLDATILISFSMALAKQKNWKIDVGNLIVISDGEGSSAVPGNLVNPLNPLKPIMIEDSANRYSGGSVPFVGTKATIKLMQLFKRYTQWNTMSIYIDGSSGSPRYFSEDFRKAGGKPEMGPNNGYASCRLPDHGGYDKNFVVTTDYILNSNKGCFFELLAGDIAKHIIDDINNDWEHA